MSILIIGLIGLAVFLMISKIKLILSKIKSESKKEEFESIKHSKVSAEQFVKTIDSLGYFKYADQRNIEKLKQDHLESFRHGGSWGGIWDDETNLPLGLRHYFCDGESVFEHGGFTGMLEEMNSTFNKIGFNLSIDSHFDEWDSKNDWINHTITLNGTDYVIFKNFKGYG